MNLLNFFKEKSRTGSQSESGFIPEGSMRKTVGCPHKSGGRKSCL